MRVRTRFLGRAVVAVAVFGMVAAACGKSSNNVTSSPTAGAVKKGGSAVFGAEQWPQCLNLITSCATSTWMQIVGPQPTVPKLVELDVKSSYAPSPLITEVPSLANGGLTQDPFTITYHLNPKAVWDDGTPITSADVEFTWKAILFTTGTTSPVGYDKIGSIDTSDPQTVKLNFTEPYADWPDLFGGGGTNRYLLQKPASPNAA